MAFNLLPLIALTLATFFKLGSQAQLGNQKEGEEMVGSAHPTFRGRGRSNIANPDPWPLPPAPYFFLEYSLFNANPMILRII